MKTRTKKQAALYERIEKHGNALLVAFPNATEKDPIKLAKKLLRLETKQHHACVQLCNGVVDDIEAIQGKTMATVCKLLGVKNGKDCPIFVNQDARGYALKTTSEFAVVQRDAGNHWFYRDMGGYGILAPKFEQGINF